MREILFRGKRIDNGEWIIGYYVKFLTDKNKTQYVIYSGYAETDCDDIYPDFFEVDPETVGQYTGLSDKNGKKIFEGDIVRYPVYQGTCRGEDIHQVVFERRGGSAYFGITMDDIETWYFCMSVPADLMEVIGNIYDSPELIGGEKQ